jgi:hypothetical protein
MTPGSRAYASASVKPDVVRHGKLPSRGAAIQPDIHCDEPGATLGDSSATRHRMQRIAFGRPGSEGASHRRPWPGGLVPGVEPAHAGAATKRAQAIRERGEATRDPEVLGIEPRQGEGPGHLLHGVELADPHHFSARLKRRGGGKRALQVPTPNHPSGLPGDVALSWPS